MRIYLVIGMVCSALLVSSCSAPVKVMAPPPPWKICAPDEDPNITGCKKEKPTSAITIRGYRD